MKLTVLIPIFIMLNRVAVAQTAPEVAISLVKSHPEIIKTITEAKNKGCHELAPSATLIGDVGYGFSSEAHVLVITRIQCPAKLARSDISTISSLVTLSSDDVVAKDGTIQRLSRVVVGAIDLNDLVFQNQSHQP